MKFRFCDRILPNNFLSIKENNSKWNRVNTPLTSIQDPTNHKTIISLIELIKKMESLLASA